MLSFHVKFVQTDRQTDGQTDRWTMVKQYAPIFQYGGIKKRRKKSLPQQGIKLTTTRS